MQRIKHHIHYYLHARHRRGHGVHPPFAYRLITAIIEQEHPYYCFDELEAGRARMEYERIRLETKRTRLETRHAVRNAKGKGLDAECSGREARQSDSGVRSGKHCLSPADAQLLFRLVNAFALHKVMEWGGIDETTRLYLTRASSKVKIYRGGPDIGVIPDLLFCNADLDEAALSQALSQKTEQSLLVLAGPHRSAGAYRCWQQLITHSEVRLSVEMKGLGLVFFDPELQKDHYILRR